MITPHDARTVLEQIDYLEETWPQLVALGLDASTKKRRHSLPTRRRRSAEAIARAEHEAEVEAAERGQPGYVPALSQSAAPVDINLLDLLGYVAAVADDLASTIVGVIGARVLLDGVVSALSDPRPRLRIARAYLTAAQDVDDRTVPWARDILTPVVRQTATELGEVVDGQVLDALCPWCGGRTERHPMGGERTMVVQAGPSAITTGRQGEEPPPPPRPGEMGWPRIVCHGLNCTPPPDKVGGMVRGQPAWPEREWDWLAKQLRQIEQPERIRA